MLIDCDTCAVRDLQCGDCVMTVLLDLTPRAEQGGYEVADEQAKALQVLAEGGLVPRLQLVRPASRAG